MKVLRCSTVIRVILLFNSPNNSVDFQFRDLSLGCSKAIGIKLCVVAGLKYCEVLFVVVFLLASPELLLSRKMGEAAEVSGMSSFLEPKDVY